MSWVIFKYRSRLFPRCLIHFIYFKGYKSLFVTFITFQPLKTIPTAFWIAPSWFLVGFFVNLHRVFVTSTSFLWRSFYWPISVYRLDSLFLFSTRFLQLWVDCTITIDFYFAWVPGWRWTFWVVCFSSTWLTPWKVAFWGSLSSAWGTTRIGRGTFAWFGLLCVTFSRWASPATGTSWCPSI